MSQRVEVDFDHQSEEFKKHHREIYRDMRNECPVAHTENYGGFHVISGYDEVSEAAHDDINLSSQFGVLIPSPGKVRLLPMLSDPPELARYRSLISPFFTPKALQAHRTAVENDIDAVIQAILERGHSELVSELCNPLPARATMRILGLDPDNWAMFGKPLHDAMFSIPRSEKQRNAIAQIHGFTAIIEAEVDARYEQPRDDLITALTTSSFEEVETTREEVYDLVRMVIFGGMDTVMAALSNIFAILAQRPELREQLAGDPSGIPRATEEFLRFEAPIQGFARTAVADTTIGGCPVNAGDQVFMLWGSANHDEKVFENPDELDLNRMPNRHFTFGIGGHRCMGSTFARTEIHIILERFLTAIPEFSLTGKGVVLPRTVGQIMAKKAVNIKVGA